MTHPKPSDALRQLVETRFLRLTAPESAVLSSVLARRIDDVRVNWYRSSGDTKSEAYTAYKEETPILKKLLKELLNNKAL
jgi:hypothetical protein